MKLKLDDKGNVVVQDGKPVYVHDDGKEIPFDAPATVAKIGALNGEAKTYRERAEAAEGKLKGFDGIEDPAKALEALKTLKNLDDKKLVDAGKVDEIKAEVTKVYEGKLAELQKVIEGKDGHIYKLEVSNRFKSSPFMEKLILPPDIAEATFGQNFKIEDGKVVGYINGNKIYSRKTAGELADFDEAFEAIIDAYPMKDRILKSSSQSGTGADQGKGGGQHQGGASVTRSQFDQMAPPAQMKHIQEGGTVTDG